MNNLIINENETKEFLQKVLKPLRDDEVYVAVLVTRKKYCPTISSSMEVVSRSIIRNNDVESTIRKLKRMSTVEELYIDGNKNIIPIEAFALYILPEPRSTLKSYNSFSDDINKWNYENLMKANIVEDAKLELYRKLDLKLFSNIHKSRSRSVYFVIDVDQKDEELLNKILLLLDSELELIKLSNILNYEIRKFNGLVAWISETHGGYHILLNRNETTGKFVHKLMNMKLPFVEFRKETMTPVCGSLQGGFIVKGVKINGVT